MSVRICLVGAGHMGRIHAQKLVQMRGVTLACVVDADPKQAAETAHKYGIPAYGSVSAAIEHGLDGAVIASPTVTHHPVAEELLEHNIHVFIEKPIATTPGEAKALIDLGRKKNLVVQVGHLERFNPALRQALPFIDVPLSILSKRTSGFTGRSTDIDVIYDLMIHDIDLVLSLSTSEPARIQARGTKVLTKKIDVATAWIEFADGCIANLTASRVSGTKERSLEIVQKNRYVSLNLGTASMFSVEKEEAGRRRTRNFTAVNPDPVNDELKAFIRAIKGKERVLVSGEDGLRALIIADAITEQIEQQAEDRRVTAIG